MNIEHDWIQRFTEEMENTKTCLEQLRILQDSDCLYLGEVNCGNMRNEFPVSVSLRKIIENYYEQALQEYFKELKRYLAEEE